ncbi:MAG: prolipoprotein diacylglyceryl transferase [Oscillospiraceae bacterium]|nr:prolipoprotein diacylglyceryl transferase [Oscillospiraceae bacterium]
MNNAMLILGGLELYRSALIIALGAAACFVLTAALYPRGGLGAALGLFACADLVLTVLFCRFLHYYCHSEQYASFWRAMTDYSVGGYVLVGAVPAALAAGWITKAAGLTQNPARLLDCFAPGAVLAAAFIRLSALYNSTCRGKIAVKSALLRRLPIASPVLSSSGAEDWRFATFFVEFLLLGAVFVLVLRFFFRRRRQAMKAGQKKDGNVALYALLLASAVELLCDSTRYDSSFMHFNGFVSISQIVCAVCILAVLVVWSLRSVRANGRSAFHWAVWVGWFFSLAGAGVCEYLVQRHGDWYLSCYLAMAVCCCFMARLPCAMYRSVCAKKKRARKEV